MSEQIVANFACPKCGCNPIILSFINVKITDASIACCKNCGAELGKYSDVRKRDAETAAEKMKQEIFTSGQSSGWKM